MKRLIFIAFLISSTAQATNAPFLAWYAQDQNGKAMPGAKLYFYQAGGAVAKNVYTDETCGTAIGASLTADGAGRFRRFYMGALNDCSSPLLYKVVFKTAGGSTVWTEDNVASQKTNLLGIVNATSASATSAITGTNTANGYAINAVASAVTATEHPLNVSGKVAAPESSAVHIVPQQNNPSVPASGDLWFDATTGKIRIYDIAGVRQLLDSNSCVVTGQAGAAGGTFTGGTGNTNGIASTGIGTGNGVSGTGGTTSGAGLYGTGGAPNGNGATCIADGTGSGINSTGGDSNGVGGTFLGGSANGIGVSTTGDGTGVGISSTGGDSNAAGGTFTGGATNGGGVIGIGSGSGYGGSFTAGASNARGVIGNGGGNGAGGYFTGGATGTGCSCYGGSTSGVGVLGTAAAATVNGFGVYGDGSLGDSTGVIGVAADADRYGVYGSNSSGVGVCANGDTTSPAIAALRIIPQDADPTGPNAIGDIYVNTAGVVHVCTTAGTPGTWTHVGAQ